MPDPLNTVGILSLEGTRVTGPGSMYDRTEIAGPTTDTEVSGATTLAIVDHPESLVPAFRAAASAAVTGGASLVVSNCGLSMVHQSAVAASAGKPTIMSSLLLLPLLWKIFDGGVGLLTYDAGALKSLRLREECGWGDDIQPTIGEVRNLDSWRSLERGNAQALPVARMERDLETVVQAVVARGGNRVILMECTAMLPYATAIRRKVGLPVFSIVTLTNFIRTGLDDANR